ncbi:MAG: hypothetical protein LBH04_01030 [Tannerellaceae bacterium]|jgi:hypothetical protein|nr:hypothetical protein [Tannerellaceae bacterium]
MIYIPSKSMPAWQEQLRMMTSTINGLVCQKQQMKMMMNRRDVKPPACFVDSMHISRHDRKRQCEKPARQPKPPSLLYNTVADCSILRQTCPAYSPACPLAVLSFMLTDFNIPSDDGGKASLTLVGHRH